MLPQFSAPEALWRGGASQIANYQLDGRHRRVRGPSVTRLGQTQGAPRMNEVSKVSCDSTLGGSELLDHFQSHSDFGQIVERPLHKL